MNYSIPQQLIDNVNSLAAATIPQLERNILIIQEIANASVILDDSYNAFDDIKNNPDVTYTAISQSVPARIKYLDKADSETELIFNGRGDSKAVSTALRQDYGIIRIKVLKQYTDLVKNSTKIIIDGFDCQLLFNYNYQTLFTPNYILFISQNNNNILLIVMPYTVIVNLKKIQDKIGVAVFNESRAIASKLAQKEVENKKEKFLQAYIENAITQQILAGGKDNYGVDGQNGNLSSFIGFDEGKEETAIEDLYGYFKKNIYLEPSYKYDKNSRTFIFKVKYPDLEEIKTFTDMTKYCSDGNGWGQGRSWAISIERGIPGLSRFKFSTDPKVLGTNSRSGTGAQRKNEIHSGAAYKPKKYISELLKILLK